MADIKISAGADPVTLVATDKVPVARSASTTAYAATMTEVGAFAASVLPYSATAPVMDGTASAGAAAAASRGDHVHPTDTSRAAVAAVPGINYANNTGFSVNQRGYVSGTALAAGAFGHDRWKGGAGGGTYTFPAPAGPSNTITITAGTLQQVIEGAALIGGNYRLSWTGTAQGRVGAGSYAASPVSVAGITAGANTTIEFNTGTLGQVKFEAGIVATPWQAFAPQQELANCQRFCCIGNMIGAPIYSTASSLAGQAVFFPVMMRAAPATVTAVGTTVNNGTGLTFDQFSNNGFRYLWTVTTTGVSGITGTMTFTASADL
jgi:hypothetical protein